MTDKTVNDLTIGTKLYGYCHGVFGRDSYEDKIIVAKGFYNGQHYIVAGADPYDPSLGYEYKSALFFAYGSDLENLLDCLEPEVHPWDY